jgi:hypothetical protein
VATFFVGFLIASLGKTCEVKSAVLPSIKPKMVINTSINKNYAQATR